MLCSSIDGFGSAKVIFNTSKPSTIPIRLVDTAKAQKILGILCQNLIRRRPEKNSSSGIGEIVV